MREIDRTNSQSDARLASAMKSLAGASPAGAPAEIADLLTGRFRRHHRRRKMQRLALAGLAACVALSAGLLLKTPATPAPQATNTQTPSPATRATATTSEAATTATTPLVKTFAPKARDVRRVDVHAARVAARNLSSSSREFVALPAYNRTVRLEDTNVVRVEMPGNSLRLVGAPVNAGDSRSRVLADFVVGRDGTPYAVRLIAVRNTQ